MAVGKWFVSTGLQMRAGRRWHVLAAAHRRWRAGYRKVHGKPGYHRFYLGPIEIEWSYQ